MNLEYKKNTLHFSGVSIKEVAKKHKTPFYLYSEEILSENYLDFFHGALEAGLHHPLICFAVKSNSNKEFLKILASLGSGADIVSGGELLRALEAGIPANKIVFSGVGKTAEEIELGLKKGVYSFNIESIEELELINTLARKLKKTARICFRFNPEVESKTHKYISTGNKTHKFGILKSDILKTLKNKKYWTHSRPVGLSIHIGSQLLDLRATKKAIERMCALALESKVNYEFLDVGGGLGIDYHPEETPKVPKISDYMNMIHQTLEKNYYSQTTNLPRVVFEPGRRISAKTGILVMSVLRNKVSENNHFTILDGGMNDMMRPSLYEAYHEIYPVSKSSRKPILSHIVGPICETSDLFGTRKIAPMKAGDLVILRDAGAYGYSMGSTYNLRGRPAELLINLNRKIQEINPAGHYKELK
ncbi:MAG TPA: diaminopimelate decarboxylase [Bacteriovoracaceae bacterium]|nr:diaminopimelate decarboxylase [Bacteriovoracaceae bacterium]